MHRYQTKQNTAYCEQCASLHWRHNGHDSVLNHQPHDCLLNPLFRRRSKKISKLRVTGLCARNSPETGEFPAQMASNAENVSIWWRHHDYYLDVHVCIYMIHAMISIVNGVTITITFSTTKIFCPIIWAQTQIFTYMRILPTDGLVQECVSHRNTTMLR